MSDTIVVEQPVVYTVVTDNQQVTAVDHAQVEVLTEHIQGPAGANGLGVPAGGTSGQYLKKNSAVDNDTSWATLVRMGTVFIVTPTNDTIPLISSSRFGFRIDELANLRVSSGSITLSIQINGVNVTGLSNLSVTATPQNPTATAANMVAIGDRVTMVLSNNVSSANLECTMKGTV